MPACPCRIMSCVKSSNRWTGRHARKCSPGLPGCRRSISTLRPPTSWEKIGTSSEFGVIVAPDASAVVELVLVTAAGAGIRWHLSDLRTSMHGPELVDLEVLYVLRCYVNAKLVTMNRATQAIGILEDLDLRRHRHRPVLRRVRSWRSNLTAYDAVYVALAEVLNGPLLTTDARPANAPNLPVPVEVFADAGETLARPGLRTIAGPDGTRPRRSACPPCRPTVTRFGVTGRSNPKRRTNSESSSRWPWGAGRSMVKAAYERIVCRPLSIRRRASASWRGRPRSSCASSRQPFRSRIAGRELRLGSLSIYTGAKSNVPEPFSVSEPTRYLKFNLKKSRELRTRIPSVPII